MNIPTKVIVDVLMFFWGVILGVSCDYILQLNIIKYNIVDKSTILILSTIQLLGIAWLHNIIANVMHQGYFFFGLITSQEVLMFRLYPKNISKK